MSPRHEATFGDALLALTTAVGLTGPDAESRTTWIHVAPFGEWSGHSAGKFSLTKDHFAAVCAQVAAKRTPVSLDYEHASIRAAGEPTPAAGFVLSTEIRADGLWACVEFTQRAAELIKAGEYRFCSGVFDFAAKDQASGDDLLCALDTIALTNRPFIDGQHPIALSRRIPLTAGASMEIDLKALAKLLDAIPGPNTADKIKKAIDLMSAGDTPEPAADAAAASKPVPPLADMTKRMSVALSDATAAAVIAAATPAPAAPAAPAVALTDTPAPAVAAADPAPMPMADLPAEEPSEQAVDDFDTKMMADLGISNPAAYAALLMKFYDAIKAVLMGTDAGATAAMSRDIATDALKAQVHTLTKELNTLRAADQEREASAAASEVDGLIKSGRLLAGQKEQAVALARKSPKEFRSLVSMLAPSIASLTQPQAVALARPAPAAEHIETTIPLDKNDPRVVELTRSLTAAGIKPDSVAFKNALKNINAAG